MSNTQQHFNQLTPAQAEALALLAEECSEVVQIACKILRHGLRSYHPQKPGVDNEELLDKEIGHVDCAIRLLRSTSIGEAGRAGMYSGQKRDTISRWLHHLKAEEPAGE